MHTAPEPKPGILEISPYVPGKARASGFTDPVKLSANENPLGCSPAAQAAYAAAGSKLNMYPDGRATTLREAVARRYGLEPERLIFGCGSDEIFTLVCQTFCEPGDNVVQGEFGFFAYRIAGRGAGAEMRFARMSEVRPEVDCLLAEVDERTRVLFLDNPGNPTGAVLSGAEVRRLHAALPPRVLLVLDGAYAEFVTDAGYEDGLQLAREASNVLATRTFSKIHGLAALRTGWGYGSDAVIGAMDRIRAPFNTSIPGQEACTAALFDDDFQARSRQLVAEERPRLAEELRRHGFEPLPSAANFVLARFPDRPGRTAPEVETHLARQGVLVRGVANYGLPDHLRITIGTPEQNRTVIRALDQLPA